MKLKIIVVILSLFQTSYFGCNQPKEATSKIEEQAIEDEQVKESVVQADSEIIVGAAFTDGYLELIQGKNVALLVNQTSRINGQHLVDLLLEKGINISKIFSPEHGFRGDADAGQKIVDGRDSKTGINVTSLYGEKKKPRKKDLEGLDWVIFDIQDVGARFYTYISTMSYVMEACADYGVNFLVLDRPNPNGHYVDGPVLKKSHQSFVGLHEVPVVHGMTVGEYAKMVNGEGWLNGKKCNLTVIPCQNYAHYMKYDLPIKPSPNLPNPLSIALYPSLCFFEGTNVSVGRGTDKQFQVIGAPKFIKGDFEFTPKPMLGARYPKHNGDLCNGYDLSSLNVDEVRKSGKLELKYLIDFYQNFPDKENFFLENLFFDKLAGGTELRNQIIDGKSAPEIRKSWEDDLKKFNIIRSKYLIYE